ncbi:MAG: phage holin family protein [Hyphomonadaceae bacterium]
MAADRSIPELTRDIAGHLGDMFRNELKLARAETVESTKQLSGAAIQLALGMAFATAAIILGLMAIAHAFAIYVPIWASFAIVAIAAALPAFTYVHAARKAISPEKFSLPKTREQIGRDIQNIKEHLPS